MSIQNEMPGYNAVDQLLNQQGVGLTPAEMHGLISGILCGGNKDSSWQPLVHDLTNEGLAFGDALAGWVNHFLLGLGVTQPKLDKVKDETGEAIDDLRNIAQLGYDEDEDQEELEMSLEEIIEYVRVAALLCHDTFSLQKPTAPEVQKPTLH